MGGSECKIDGLEVGESVSFEHWVQTDVLSPSKHEKP